MYRLPSGDCPAGQEMGYTGRCVAACERGQVRNPKTNRCVTKMVRKTLRPAVGTPFKRKSKGGHYVRKHAPQFQFLKSVHGFDTAREPMVRYVTPAYRQVCPRGMYLDPRTMKCKRGVYVGLGQRTAPPAGSGRYREVYGNYRSHGYHGKKVQNRVYKGFKRDQLTKYKVRGTKRDGSKTVARAKHRIVPRAYAKNAKHMNQVLANKPTAERLEVHRRRQKVRLIGHAWRMALAQARAAYPQLALNREQRMVQVQGKRGGMVRHDPDPQAYRKLMQKAKVEFFPPMKAKVLQEIAKISSLSQKPSLSVINSAASAAQMPAPTARPKTTRKRKASKAASGAPRRRSMRLRNLAPQGL